ncbi:MAG: malonyl CoA-acyl carrier protein transacylase [Cyclobacteriaceae bacterium]|nr:MAG: malonyl CoA-acyl carrier protein transacylase [Cyclobacteriaceae bacterium]
MGQDLATNQQANELYQKADQLLGFPLTGIMFTGSKEELTRTDVTQPAIFLHSVVLALINPDFQPDVVAGHSLGEFSALVASGSLSFENGLKLVAKRADAMQKACESQPGTMAAVLGLDDAVVEEICASIDDVVVPANYNCPGQLVISGSRTGVELACKKLTEAGARRALILPVGGAFHSPLMEPAREELARAIENTEFIAPSCPIVQNVDGQPHVDINEIKENLIAQLTAPVRWTQSVQQIAAMGADSFIETGPGKVLQGLVKKINSEAVVSSYGL